MNKEIVIYRHKTNKNIYLIKIGMFVVEVLILIGLKRPMIYMKQ